MRLLPPKPESPEDWRDLVNAAELMLLLRTAQVAGLVSVKYGQIQVDQRRCETVLREGQKLGIIPDGLEARAAALQRTSER